MVDHLTRFGRTICYAGARFVTKTALIVTKGETIIVFATR
jgi:hypothetical protein